MKKKHVVVGVSSSVAAFILTLVLLFAFLPVHSPAKYEPEVHTAQTYRDLLQNLTDQGYAFRLPTDEIKGKTAILIHDVDFNYTGARVLTEVEKEFNTRSCFYLRPDAEYYTQSIPFFLKLQSQGWQIGIQYDTLSRTGGNQTLALELFKAQLAYMRAFFNVSSSTYHGDKYNSSILNLNLYRQNVDAWRQLGLKEVYSLDDYSYVRDTNNILVVPDMLGDLVLVQLHSDWW